MNGGTLASIAAMLGALILVGSGLMRRRLGQRRLGRLALIWAGIILIVWAAASFGLGHRISPHFT